MTKLLIAVPLALILACAAQKEETKSAGQASQEANSQAGKPIEEGAQSAVAGVGANAAAAASAAAEEGKQAAAGAAQSGKEAAAAAGKQAAATGTAAAAQVVQGVTGAAAEPAMMPDAEFRKTRPTALAVQPHFMAPVPVEKKLKNGARVLIVENHQVPLVAIEVRFLHGTDVEPKGQWGLAQFVADLADEGTKTRSATKFAEEVEDLAASLSANAGLESAAVHLNCLTETLPKALDLLADLVQNPAFRKEDVERVRGLKLTQLEQKKASIGALANDEANRILYGDQHPWGQPSGGTPQSIGAITSDDLAKYHDAWWVPNNAVIAVSGDIKTAEVVKLLDKAFAGWKAKPLSKVTLPALPNLTERSIDAVEKPTATQSQVWVVGRLFPASSPDAVTMRLANLILGGFFTSRLNMNLREKHGYSYGVRSGANLMRNTGSLTAAGGIVAKNTVEALGEYEKELTIFSSGEVTDEELAAAKELFIRSVPSSLETNDAVASAMTNLVSLKLPLDNYKTLAARTLKITKQDVARVARKWITPARFPVVIVGPVGQSKDALDKLGFGKVTLVPAASGAPAQKPGANGGPGPAAAPQSAQPQQGTAAPAPAQSGAVAAPAK